MKQYLLLTKPSYDGTLISVKLYYRDIVGGQWINFHDDDDVRRFKIKKDKELTKWVNHEIWPHEVKLDDSNFLIYSVAAQVKLYWPDPNSLNIPYAEAMKQKYFINRMAAVKHLNAHLTYEEIAYLTDEDLSKALEM